MSSIAFSSSSPAPAESRSVSRGRFALVGLGTVAAAVIANLLVYLLGSVVVGYDPQFVVLANASGTILFTVVPAIVAVLLYAALMRFTSNPARIFTNIAVVVLIVSLIPDLTYIPSVPGASSGQTAILMLMHVVAAGVIVWMLTTLTRSRRT
ncbi:MAG: hypothetical protein K0S99_3629 [Thermomicrobiales bacterium]|jgi:hypothetical protein|nr:hypothetical protein [Thermomicrobiales bacterium]